MFRLRLKGIRIEIERGLDIWIHHGNAVIGLRFYPNRLIRGPWIMLPRTNGAKKGVDNCLDINAELLGFHFNYTDFNYGRFKYNKKGNK